MAKCLNCGTIYCVYGGSEGSQCPTCKSKNIDTSKEGNIFQRISNSTTLKDKE